MVLSSYPLQAALYFKWVTLAEWIGITIIAPGVL